MQEVSEAIEGVLGFLRAVPLSNETVKGYQIRYRLIQKYCRNNGIIWFSHNEAQLFTDMQMVRCKSDEISARTFRNLRRAAFLLAKSSQDEALIWGSTIYPERVLSEHYADILSKYKSYLSTVLAPSTTQVVLSKVRQFLLFIESGGLWNISQLTELHVKHFMKSIAEKWPGTMQELTWVMKKFMLFLNETSLTSINADRYLQRPAPRKKKVLPCFSAKEVDSILSAVNKTTALGKRDYAIMKIAIETGLRGVDILNLKLSDINWRKCEIAVIQSKTEEALQLPLLADVGNAIADYILHARPQSESPHIFLRSVKPYTKLRNGGNGKNIINRYLDKAGVAHVAWDGKSFHAFRRTQGTRLLEAEVPLKDVAQLLGHNDFDSTKRYIYQNDEKMRDCCLSISEYATGKDGLV